VSQRRKIALGYIVTGMLLTACLASQFPVNRPSVSVPSIPSVKLPTVAIPSLTIPTVSLPVIGLTLAPRAINTPVATSTTAPIPVTGAANQALQWVIYGFLALLGILLVIIMFARFLRHTDRPDE
jgi:hypothetical protein